MNIPQPITLDIEVSDDEKSKKSKRKSQKPKTKNRKDEKQTTHGNKSSTKSQNISRVKLRSMVDLSGN
jgi:hypothetical protein